MTKKKKRSIFDDIFGFSLFDEIEEVFNKAFEGFEGGFTGSYSMQVVYTDEGPVVYAELSDDMDANEFRKMLEQKYPGAKIVIKGGKQGEKFKVIERKAEQERRVEIKLEDEQVTGEKSEDKKQEDSLFSKLHGKKGAFIVRED